MTEPFELFLSSCEEGLPFQRIGRFSQEGTHGRAALAGQNREAVTHGGIHLGAVVNVENLDRAALQVDAIDHVVGASSRAQAAGQWPGQGLAHAQWILSQGAVEEIQYGSRDGLW